jgi:hypothetical protein
MAKDDKSDDSSNKPKGKKPVSREEQAANIKAALDKAGTSATPTSAKRPPKRRGRGLTAKEIESNTQNEPGAKKGSNKESSSKPSVAKSKAESERRAAYNYALDEIMLANNIDDTAEGRQRAVDIYRQQRGIDESGAGVEMVEDQALEVPVGLFRGSTGASDAEYEDMEASDVDTGLTESSLRGRGAALGSPERTASSIEAERTNAFGTPSGIMEQASPEDPNKKLYRSRTAELALGIGARRQPGEVDPADYWSMNEAPKSVEEAQAQLADARARQKAFLDEGINVSAGSGDSRKEAVVTAQGTESLAKANKSTDVENSLRLRIAQLEEGIEKGLFGQGPTTLKQRREQGTVGQGVDTTPIQKVRRLGEATDLEGGTDTGLSEEAIKLLRGVGSTEIMRKGQSPTGVDNAVSGYIEPTSQADLDKRGDILDLEIDPETGESRLANPLERRSPVITDPATGETRPNPNYTIRSEGGVEIKAGDDGETDETLNAYRETLGNQMVGAKGGAVPEGLVRIQGEGRRGRSWRKRRVRGDYQGPTVTERTIGLGPAYESMRDQLLSGQFGRGRERNADRIIESMIETEGTEALTEDIINTESQMSEARPMEAAGDLERAKRGSIGSIPVSKQVPVMITRDLDGNPLPQPRIETQVGARSANTSERTEEGGRRRVNYSYEDVMNLVGGPAITRDEPVYTDEVDPVTGEKVQAEDKDYPIDSPRRFRVRRKTYLPADVIASRKVPTVADPNKKVTRVTRGIDINETNTGQPLKQRMFRLYRDMNFGRTNMPPAPEGTPMTLGQQFAQEHGLPRPAYDEGFAAEVGTPEEVKAGFERDKQYEKERAQTLYEAAQSLPRKSPEEHKAESEAASRSRLDRINESKDALIGAASTADVNYEVNGNLYNSAGELTGSADPQGADSPSNLARRAGSLRVVRPVKASTLPGIDTDTMPAEGTRLYTPQSGKNKGVTREIPDVSKGKTKGFRQRYMEAYRSSPRAKWEAEHTEFQTRLANEAEDLDLTLSGQAPKRAMAPLPEGWHSMTEAQQKATGYVPGRTMKELTPEERKAGDQSVNRKPVYKDSGRLVPESVIKGEDIFRPDITGSSDDKRFGFGGERSPYRFESYPELVARRSSEQGPAPKRTPSASYKAKLAANTSSGSFAESSAAFDQKTAEGVAGLSDDDLTDIGIDRSGRPLSRNLGPQFGA